MKIPISYQGSDPAIPTKFVVELPPNISWLADTIDEIVSLAPQLFRSSTNTLYKTSKLCGNLPVRRVSKTVIVVGYDKAARNELKPSQLNISAPSPS